MDEEIMRRRIDKELLRHYEASTGFDFQNLEQFVQVSNALDREAVKEDPALHIYERVIPGPSDHPALKVRIYEPAGRTELLPGLLFFHGGGFLFGSVYRHDNMCQRFSKHANLVVISVEYRLSPRWKAPAPVEDGYAALCWLEKEGVSIGMDNTKLGIAGISAGGTIVAALAILTRDRKGPQPVIQMPLYASLDNRFLTLSSKEITSPKVWSYPYSMISWEHYLDRGKAPDCYAVPALCRDYAGLPPLYSYVGGLDPFRDENVAFWNKLMAAGVTVESHIYPGCFHCFEVSVPDASLSDLAYKTTYTALKRAFR